jgi:hypothetical protein
MIWNYVDPGIGGLILQGLIAGAAAIWLFFRRDIPALFRKIIRKKRDSFLYFFDFIPL